MSEETSSSAPSSEIAKPEPSPEPSPSAPPKGGKKKLWIMIASVAVVALLVGSVVYVMFLAPIKVSMEPADAELTVDAGKVLLLSVKVKKGLGDITDNDDVTYLWTVLPNNIGSWQRRADPSVNLTAGKVEGAGTVTCVVKYKGEAVTVSKPLSVLPPYLDQVTVSPSTKTMERGLNFNFTASAVDSVADSIPGLTYTWSMAGDVAGECTLSSTTGTTVEFTSGPTYGNVTLTATATSDGVTKSGAASITVGPLPPRSVDYYWYDMFNVPFGEWWDMRASVGKTEVPLTDEYPYIFLWQGAPEGNIYLYSNMRLNVTARNMSEVNMNEKPEFLPLHGSTTGGTAVIDWYLQYLTTEEMARFPEATAGWNDGWVVSLNGTATLDKQAALSVIAGLTSEGYDDFGTWWSQHRGEVSNDFGDWFKYEAGKERLDIFPAYDYELTTLAWKMDAEKVGDKIVLHYDFVTWGMEMLLSMWMREAFMPTEWYFEDMNFHATIGPEWTDLDADTAVAYAVYSYETTNEPIEPCWVWEALLQDYVEAGPPEHRESLYNAYTEFEYLNTAPGSSWYGKEMTYDYTPGIWNLSENETLKFTWPDGDQNFLVHVGAGEWSNYSNEMVATYFEPMDSDAAALLPGTVTTDNVANTITYVGPIDMWQWSKDQTNPEHWWLSQEWDRMEMLPYGAPYIEWKPLKYVTEPDHLGVDVPDLPVIDVAVDMEVTCYDQFGRVYPTYNGTVEVLSNRTGVTTLPADYTFVIDDSGVATISGLTFSELGWFTISVRDVANNSISGFDADIYVVPDPEVIDHFTVEVPGVNGFVLPGLPADVYVTAHNQYDNRVFKSYSGTVNFTTDAPAGTYTMPADFTFSPSMKGVAVVHGLTYSDTGTYGLTVADTVTTTATGSTTVMVSIPPSIDYRIYDMFEQPWGEWWPYRLPVYRTDIILVNESHHYTMIYNPDARGRQTIIMAPYRWNVTAVNMSTLSVNDPAIMPVFGSAPVDGARANVDLYWEYINQEWWDSYWVPTWSSNDNWTDGENNIVNESQRDDGYYIGVAYNVKMNREAAESWMNMPQAADPLTWWAANKASYMDAWRAWLLEQGNVEFDIYPGYEWALIDMGTMMDLTVDGDDVVLSIGHYSWGFEVLITRWMTDRAICTHEPYMEDFQLVAQFETDYANVTYDAVAQYNLHAVKANLTESDAAWCWEPQHIDYISWEGSEFNPWAMLTYNSWNSGDQYLNDSESPVSYDFTPTVFDLASYMTLTVELPLGDDVIGYRGLPTPAGSITLLKAGDSSAYDSITVFGPMWLGYHLYPDVPGAPDLSGMYDNATKVLFLQGPMTFDNFHHESGELYHSAPWLEFNVANFTWPGAGMLSVPVPDADASMGGSAISSTSAAMIALAIAIALSIVATVLVVVEVRREE